MPYDAIVVGLGGMGSSAALHLARRGQRVLGIDRNRPAHDQGSSHGGSRIVRQSYFEDPAYVPLLLRSYELWEALGRDSGSPVHRLTGGLFLGAPGSRTFGGSLAASQQWGLPHEVLDAAEVHRRFPTMRPAADQLALHEAAAGVAVPELTVAAQLELAARAGAELRFGSAVTSWSSSGAGAEVRTADGVEHAGELVLAPGPWAPSVLADLQVAISVERQIVFWFQPVGGAASHAPELQPIWIQEQGPDKQVYGFPALDGPGGGVKVAYFRAGRPCTPETIDRSVTRAEVEEIGRDLRRTVPTLPGTLLRAGTCMYSTTPDEHFVVARHPAHEHVTVACGFSGHGFKFVPVMGEVLADLAIDGRTEHPIELFDPARPAVADVGAVP